MKDRRSFMECPHCQAQIQLENEYFDSITDALCYVIIMCGEKPYEALENRQLLKNCLCDLLGTEYPDREAFERAMIWALELSCCRG